MIRKSVVSSNLRSVGYDQYSNILEVEFRNNRIYQYSRVPLHAYQGLMSAASHGIYFDRYIKKGGYPCRQTH